MSCLYWFVKFLMENVERQPGDAGGIRDREAIPGDLEGPEADVVVRQVPVDTVRRFVASSSTPDTIFAKDPIQ